VRARGRLVEGALRPVDRVQEIVGSDATIGKRESRSVAPAAQLNAAL
jgi:hypothetical protein